MRWEGSYVVTEASANTNTNALEVRNLSISVPSPIGRVNAVTDVSFDLPFGETIGLVGESGSGKSLTSLAIMRLLPNQVRIEQGSVNLLGQDLTKIGIRELRQHRGSTISMVFQEPMTSLNPAYTIGDQIGEVLRKHRGLSRKESIARAIELLDRVGIAAADRRVRDYPHAFSGGMRQRAMIAMAIACEPAVLLADEPTTALDVTVQKQILDLLAGLQREMGMSVLFVTHDLGVISEIASRVVVMYAGEVVESGPTGDLIDRPRHPYLEGLLGAVPRVDRRLDRLREIPGSIPQPSAIPPGCRFHPRCAYAVSGRCDVVPIELRDVHQVTTPVAVSGHSGRSDLAVMEPSEDRAIADHWARCIRLEELELDGGDA